MGIFDSIRRVGSGPGRVLLNFLKPYTGATTLHETSYLGVNPGDLVQFDYPGGPGGPGGPRVGLVVSSRRTSSGLFLSSKLNLLINIVEVESLTDSMFSVMVNTLYQNSYACNYYSNKIIGSFLGKDKFKTFNVANVTNLLNVKIRRKWRFR